MEQQLVLSLFPGLDLLGRAFEAEGFCVVRGPEKLLGGTYDNYHVPPGRFDGVIGTPSCKMFSVAANGRPRSTENDIPDFERIVAEAQPRWWIMENLRQAPVPRGALWTPVLDAWLFGAAQHRRRRFSSNLELPVRPVPESRRHPDPWPTVTALEYKYHHSPNQQPRGAGRKVGRRMTVEEMNEACGLPLDYELPPLLLARNQYILRGREVPMQMGRALARAVKRYYEE